MDRLLNALLEIGPGVLLLGVVVAIAIAIRRRVRGVDGSASWVARFVLGSSAVGAAAFVAGSILGIAVFCAPDDAGNLCGLGGLFGTGPLLAGVAIAIYACRNAGAPTRA